MTFSRRKFLLSAPAATAFTRGQNKSEEPPRSNVLWYTKPASQWVEALPIGNGRMGAMVFGGIAEERLQLNEDSVWAGSKRDRINPAAARAIPEVRRLLSEGRVKEAETIADRDIIAVGRRMPPYQPLGDLRLTFREINESGVSRYRRELDLESGVAAVSFTHDGHDYTRTALASVRDGIIAVHLATRNPRGLAFTATLTREADSETRAEASGRVVLAGQALVHDKNHPIDAGSGTRFACLVDVKCIGGTCRAEGDRVIVEGATEATLLIAGATDYRYADPLAQCRQQVSGKRRPFAQIRNDHTAEHSALFRRVRLDLGNAGEAASLPTDERLKRVAGSQPDPGLESLYFQFGRYLLMASSRPGSLPATLQGIWNDSLTPAWDSKYTININTEMNYWPAGVCNLSEMQLPLFDLIEKAREEGRRVARTMYGANGFVLHHNTDAWGDAVPIDGVGSGIWPMGAAWLCLHYWDHYEITGDRDFLAKRAYPVMKEAAEFLLDYLVDDGKGHLISGPSISPENRFRTPDGQVGKLCMGPTMDQEIAGALFRRVAKSAEILGVDAEFAARVNKAERKLLPLQIGKHGQLQEWMQDYDEPEPGHRHISHLFALHPDNAITLRATPELARAARTSLERRLSAGSGHTGWSRAWIINFWARLEEGEKAHENLVALLAKSTLPNLFDTHPPFQIDGNFGAAGAITEMLLASHAGEIHFLPALPSSWREGSVAGLRARHAVELAGLEWSKGRAVRASVRTTVRGNRVLRAPKGQTIARVLAGAAAVPNTSGEVVKLPMNARVLYTVEFA